MDFLNKIPEMDRDALRELKKGIDLSFKEFSREYGDSIEGFFDPLLHFLIWLEKLLVSSPWPLVIGVFGLLAWIGSRSIKLVIGTMICFLIIGYFGMWKNCMATVAIISVSTLVCIVVGIPIGIPTTIQTNVETEIIATVAIQFFHIPKYPMIRKQIIVPITNLILLDPIHANNPKTPITNGHGLLTNSFSNHIKKCKRGSKKPSIESPYSLENSLKLKSIPFFNSLKASLSISGILFKKSIIFLFLNPLIITGSDNFNY